MDLPECDPTVHVNEAANKSNRLGARTAPIFTLAACRAIQEVGSTIVLVEGEKKSLSAQQAGFACIGLLGVWGWQRRREKDEGGVSRGQREFIADLAGIDWVGRMVPIIFDADSYRNCHINLAAAELARLLTSRGAIPIIVTLPVGSRGPDGLPGKMGVDDFIVSHGHDAFRRVVQTYLSPEEVRSLDDYRQNMERARLESVGVSGVYLDTSPPGAGKSYADLPAAVKPDHH